LADPQPGNDRTADRQLELADEVASVLEHLSRRQRRILVLWSEGWSVRDIADELGLSAARVSDEKYKALYKLRQVFAEHGPENGDRVRST
jgi:RNA polymerase sigma factor (sigma-70 family)